MALNVQSLELAATVHSVRVGVQLKGAQWTRRHVLGGEVGAVDSICLQQLQPALGDDAGEAVVDAAVCEMSHGAGHVSVRQRLSLESVLALQALEMLEVSRDLQPLDGAVQLLVVHVAKPDDVVIVGKQHDAVQIAALVVLQLGVEAGAKLVELHPAGARPVHPALLL